jgi:hypothetical protein
LTPAAEGEERARFDPTVAKAREMIRRLDPEVVPPDDVLATVRQIGTASVAQRPLLVDDLRHRIDELNGAARRRNAAAPALAAAEALVQQTNDRELAQILERARTAHAADRPVDLKALREAAERAERRQAAAAEQEFVQETVVKAFEAIGYRVVSGSTLLTPDGGLLVRRGEDQSAAQVAVSAGAIEVAPVRLVENPTAPAGTRDKREMDEDLRATEALCADEERVWASIANAGISVRDVHRAPPGTVPPRRVALANGVDPPADPEAIVVPASRRPEMERRLGRQ